MSKETKPKAKLNRSESKIANFKELYGTGWPCHSFIKQPIYRKLVIGRDVKITDKGVIVRRDAGAGLSSTGYLYSFLTWSDVIRGADFILQTTESEPRRD